MTCVVNLPKIELISPVDAVIVDDKSGLTSGEIIIIPVPTADTELTYALPAGVKAFVAKLLVGKLSIRFTGSGDYATRSPGTGYVSGRLSAGASPMTLYFKSSKNSDTMEIETWV